MDFRCQIKWKNVGMRTTTRFDIFSFFFSSIQNTSQSHNTHTHWETARKRERERKNNENCTPFAVKKKMKRRATIDNKTSKQALLRFIALSIFAFFLFPIFTYLFAVHGYARSAWFAFEWKLNEFSKEKKSKNKRSSCKWNCMSNSHGFITRSHTHFHNQLD